MYPFFIFLTLKKLEIETLKSALGRSISHYYHFFQYLNNYLGQLIVNQYIISKQLFRSTNLKPMYMFRGA